MKRLFAVVAAVALSWGCTDGSAVHGASQDLFAPDWSAAAAAANGLTVMEYNVYYGADYSPLLMASPEEIPIVAAQTWAAAAATDFPGRAGQIAAEIAAARPHLVGLQEAAIYRLQHPGDAIIGGTIPATDVVVDFVELIRDSLAAHGIDYVVVAADSTTDIELPIFTGFDAGGNPTFDDIRLTDRDALLARADVQVANAAHGVYAAYIPIDFGAFQTGVYEGWSAADVTVNGHTFRVLSTHLEYQEALPVQLGQAQELLGMLADETRPTILLGDFNSDAYGADPTRATPTLGMMLDAGFADAWVAPGRQAPGLTCCQASDLLNAYGAFDERGDFVFSRNLPDGVHVVARHILGDRPGDRLPSGLWPSDHAAIVATFR